MGRVRAFAVALALLLAGCALDYPRLGIHTAVIDGGQAEIDQGHVVNVDGLPGDWIAAHRTVSGGPFRNLLGAQIGDEVDWAGKRYVVVDLLYVPQSYPAHYLGPLVLQTSLPGGGALLVVCNLA